MKVVKIICPECEKFTEVDLNDFRWDIKYIDGVMPGDHFFEMPSSICCQDCLHEATWRIVDR